MNTCTKHISGKIIPKRKVNRFYLVFLVISFFIGFFYNSNEHSDTFYSNLIRANKIIDEIKSGNCDDLNNYESYEKLKSSGIGFEIELAEKRGSCREFINALSLSEYQSFPLTENLIDEEFDKEFKYYTLKNNANTGVYFFFMALLFLLLVNFIRKIITWIMSGS